MLSSFYRIRLGKPKPAGATLEQVIKAKKDTAAYHLRRSETLQKQADEEYRKYSALEQEACELEDGNG